MSKKLLINDLEHLKRFCVSNSQLRTIEALIASGGVRTKAAKMLGLNESTVRKTHKRVLNQATIKGWVPDHGMKTPYPDAAYLKNATIHRKDGKVVQTWERMHVEAEELRSALDAFATAYVEDHITPKDIKPWNNREVDDQLIPWINIGDAHIGMLAHEAETGANFDLKIAERELCAGIKMLIDEAPDCERVVIQDMGDMTHYENTAGVTEASGHALDCDGRYAKMMHVYTRTMLFIIDYALTKFKYVDVIINQGNHSRTNDIAAAKWITHVYRNASDRVTVLDNASVFIPYRMGDTFVLCHHSDKCKPNQLAHVMATHFHHDWGEAKHRYIDIGHIHHNMVSKEHPGVKIESFNILAEMDKYAFEAGYSSRQAITMLFRHKKYGEIGRRLLPILEIRDCILEAMADSEDQQKPDRRKVYTV